LGVSKHAHDTPQNENPPQNFSAGGAMNSNSCPYHIGFDQHEARATIRAVGPLRARLLEQVWTSREPLDFRDQHVVDLLLDHWITPEGKPTPAMFSFMICADPNTREVAERHPDLFLEIFKRPWAEVKAEAASLTPARLFPE
jgi:hypothetical protein